MARTSLPKKPSRSTQRQYIGWSRVVSRPSPSRPSHTSMTRSFSSWRWSGSRRPTASSHDSIRVREKSWGWLSRRMITLTKPCPGSNVICWRRGRSERLVLHVSVFKYFGYNYLVIEILKYITEVFQLIYIFFLYGLSKLESIVFIDKCRLKTC